MDQIHGQREQFYKLEIDGVCLLDSFESELPDNLAAERRSVYTRMQKKANGFHLPPEHYHPLGDLTFEFKTHHLRYYGIHLKRTGKIIVIGGFKGDQDSDISRLNTISSALIDSLQEPKKKIK